MERFIKFLKDAAILTCKVKSVYATSQITWKSKVPETEIRLDKQVFEQGNLTEFLSYKVGFCVRSNLRYCSPQTKYTTI